MRIVSRTLARVFVKKHTYHHAPFRILIQSINFSPEVIGVGKYSGELAQWLASRGHRVEAVVAHPHYPGFAAQGARAGGYARGVESGVAVTRCPLVLRHGGRGLWRLVAPVSFAVAAAPVVIWRALRDRPAVVLCVEPTLAAAPAAILAARLVGAALVLHVQDLEVDAAFATAHLRGRALRWMLHRLERRLLRAFDGVITISDAMAARLAAKGVAADRLTVLRNWIGAARAGPVACPRAGLGIAPEGAVILYAGHLGAKQDIPLLLEAFSRLSAVRPVRLVIVGEGPMAAAVEAARAGMPNLTLLPLQTAERHRQLLAMADLHVLPQDPRAADLVFPSKLGAMLASGRPVVVTANAGSELARWLGDAALVVPPGDPAGLAAALATALDEPADRRTRAARALARTLDADTVLPAFEACLMRAVARRRQPHGALPVSWPAVPAAGTGMQPPR